MNSEIILTRYLYNKSNVLLSLQQSFDTKDYDSELYWTYEMYYSGFEEEIIKYLLDIMENKYKNHPKLNSYIRKKYTDKNTDKNTLPATIIKNLSMNDPEKPETSNPRLQYNGKIDNRKKTVEFMNEDEYELFHDKFNYEPDEQSLELQKNCMGIL